MDLLCYCSVLCLLCLCACLFICALWSPAWKGLIFAPLLTLVRTRPKIENNTLCGRALFKVRAKINLTNLFGRVNVRISK